MLNNMAIYQLGDRIPRIDLSAFIFDSADIIGDVVIGAQASIWANVSIRGDNTLIDIGHHSNVQEGSVLHSDEDAPLTIAEYVTVGHQAMLHGCTIGTGSLVGMQAIVLNRARIGRNCLIGAGAIVSVGAAAGAEPPLPASAPPASSIGCKPNSLRIAFNPFMCSPRWFHAPRAPSCRTALGRRCRSGPSVQGLQTCAPH